MFSLHLSVMGLIARIRMDRIPGSDQLGLSSILKLYLRYLGSRVCLLLGLILSDISLELSPIRDNLFNIYPHSNTVKEGWVILKTLQNSSSFTLAMDCWI